MPTLVDTSVWVGHLCSDSSVLQHLLEQDLVMCHPLVIGELACGHMKHRAEVLASLAVLPATRTVEYEELLAFIDTHKLFGQGLGWIDVHLLASAVLERVSLWTHDQALRQATKKLHCSFEFAN